MKQKLNRNDFKPGNTVEFAGQKWNVLAQVSENNFLCVNNGIIDHKEFDEDNNNNWSVSSLRKYLNGEYLQNFSGLELIPWTQDLTTDDGLKDYGSSTDLIFLLTDNQYRAYRQYMRRVDDWWWLITADSPINHYARLVNSDGALGHYDAYYGNYGVRPACVIHLQSDEEIEEEKENEETDAETQLSEMEKAWGVGESYKEQMTQRFKEDFAYIKRPGAEKLLQYLEDGGFFEAPASTQYHGSYAGGLVEHSVNVFKRLVELVKHEEKEAKAFSTTYTIDTLATVALLHDVCKMDAYKKDDKGGYTYTNNFPVGHSEKSIFRILQYMQLTDEEIMALRWHMGKYDYAAQGGGYDLNNAFRQSKLAVMLHIADMEATHLDERG